MPTIPNSNPIPGGGGSILVSPGAPSAGTSEVQTLTFGGTGAAGDTFRLSFDGQKSAAISWSATNATLVANVDAALEALATVGANNVTTAVGSMTAGIGTITLTFAGNLAAKAVPTVVVSDLATTASLAVSAAETTPGVDATFRKAPKGAVAADSTNAKLYVNTGTPPAPTWTVAGTQT